LTLVGVLEVDVRPWVFRVVTIGFRPLLANADDPEVAESLTVVPLGIFGCHPASKGREDRFPLTLRFLGVVDLNREVMSQRLTPSSEASTESHVWFPY
jgi:hypothetical protein